MARKQVGSSVVRPRRSATEVDCRQRTPPMQLVTERSAGISHSKKQTTRRCGS